MFGELARGPLGPSGHATTALIPLARDDRNASGLDRFPVIVVHVGTVEAFDHLGGAGAGFDGLEDAEGNENAAAFVIQAVHVDDEGDVREGLGEVEGVDADLPVLTELTPVLQSALGFSHLSP